MEKQKERRGKKLTINNSLYQQHQKIKAIEKSLGLTPLQLKIYKFLITDGPCTRGEICKAFGHEIIEYDTITYTTRKAIISNKGYPQHRKQFEKATTIYDNLEKLEKKELVEKYTVSNGQRGRPKTYWRVINHDGK